MAKQVFLYVVWPANPWLRPNYMIRIIVMHESKAARETEIRNGRQ